MRKTEPLMLAALLLSAALLGACETAPKRSVAGDVRIDPVDPPDAQRIELAAGETFVAGQAVSDERKMPVYPADLLSNRLPPIRVCAELQTDTAGRVVVSRPVLAPGCDVLPDQQASAFIAAVNEAVLTWRYEPSYFCSGQGAGADPVACGSERGEAVPLLRAYRFVFSQRLGKPIVSMSRAPRR